MANLLDKFIPEIEPAWMRPPLWRWLEASEFLADPHLSITRASDETVRGAAYLLRARAGKQGQPLARQYPAYHLAHKLFGLASQYGGMRWQIEALMLAGLTDQQLAKMLPMFAGETVFGIYRKLFFDIDEYRDNPFAVLSNIFAASYSRNYVNADVDLTWKMLAYELKGDFPQLLLSVAGGRLPESIRERLRELTEIRALYVQHHLTNTMRLEFNEETLALLDKAQQNWQLNPQQTRGIQDRRLTDTCERLLSSIQLVIIDSHAKLSAVERLQQDVDVKALTEHFSTK
jgi:hypothetical protein